MNSLPENEIIDLLVNLIKAKSVNPPGREEVAARVLEDFFRRKGLEVRLDYISKGRPNVLCKVKGSGSGKSILLTSHLDVVPAGKRNLWNHNPFKAEILKGKMYGRGACDAKGSLAAMAASIAFLSTCSTKPGGDILFAAVCGEEKGGLGSKKAVKSGLIADAAIVGEPTDLDIAVSQKGRISIYIDVLGRSTHPSHSDEGINPILQLPKLISFLGNYPGKQVNRGDESDDVLIINRIQAGKKNVLSTPDKCSLTLSEWIPAWQTQEASIAEFEELINAYAEENDLSLEISFRKGASPYSVSEKETVVQSARKAIVEVTGSKPKIIDFPASCDMYVFGRAGVPTIVLGPGDLAYAHKADECIKVDDVVKACKIYSKAILNFFEAKGENLSRPPGFWAKKNLSAILQ